MHSSFLAFFTFLGSAVYTARLKMKFKDGKTKQKLYRVGVIK